MIVLKGKQVRRQTFNPFGSWELSQMWNTSCRGSIFSICVVYPQKRSIKLLDYGVKLTIFFSKGCTLHYIRWMRYLCEFIEINFEDVNSQFLYKNYILLLFPHVSCCNIRNKPKLIKLTTCLLPVMKIDFEIKYQ